MSDFIFVSAPRFTRYETLDLFSGERVPCDESLFDAIVVKFRDEFTLEYVRGGQHFYSEDGYEFWRFYK